ncbi:DVU3141 family protein [Halomonas halmophila]|uniref:Surface antigen domain-containing protein n=1 Tax=Halomonas halmophila TaxID=252 RepID=A0A4Y4F6F9_9GAMM|nr:DVU3141 family protein [Halomonas halmophila]GED23444.1 hypothetical protein HHA01_24210 [Halomonas halmophila]
MPHQHPGRGLRRSASVLLLALAAGLTGCAAQQGYQNDAGSVVANTQGTPVGANLNGFLSQAAPGSTVVLQQSPWGANVEVMAEASYFAASGRECRHLQVTSLRGSSMRTAVACKTADGSWVAHRLVTQTQSRRMGR